MKPLTQGLRPLPHDERDINLGALEVYPKLSELPANYSLGQPLWIGNQLAVGEDDFCTAYATSGASSYQEGVRLYPALSFAFSKQVSGNTDAWGQDLRSAMAAHVKSGACEPNDLTEQDRNLSPKERRDWKNYSVSAVSAAKKHYKKSYVTCKGPYDTFDNIRAALWMYRNERRAVVFGIEWKWDLSEYVLVENNTRGFGHAMYAIGWTPEGLIVVNSAGEEAGRQGTHLIPRDHVNKNIPIYGEYMFLDETPDSLRDRLVTEVTALQILVNFFLYVYKLIGKATGFYGK